MIGSKDVLLMPVAAGRKSQPVRRDSAVVVAACSRQNVRMPDAAQVAAGQSSAGVRRQITVAASKCS